MGRRWLEVQRQSGLSHSSTFCVTPSMARSASARCASFDTQKCCCAHFTGEETEARRGHDLALSAFSCRVSYTGTLQLREVMIWANHRGGYLLAGILVLIGVLDSSSSRCHVHYMAPAMLLRCLLFLKSIRGSPWWPSG